ncbi:hypothetical protein [Paenibacillus sp. ISL-20]|uniref:hypothetical protein n=1 Tax=Paenibacillus sp. ISL-20 TaxID=2819163 RepID=UPI001BE9A3BE|nr:hypothetical protein [Paenibacillus sp. ISL-20]
MKTWDYVLVPLQLASFVDLPLVEQKQPITLPHLIRKYYVFSAHSYVYKIYIMKNNKIDPLNKWSENNQGLSPAPASTPNPSSKEMNCHILDTMFLSRDTIHPLLFSTTSSFF